MEFCSEYGVNYLAAKVREAILKIWMRSNARSPVALSIATS